MLPGRLVTLRECMFFCRYAFYALKHSSSYITFKQLNIGSYAVSSSGSWGNLVFTPNFIHNEITVALTLNETEVGKNGDFWSFRGNISKTTGDMAYVIISNLLIGSRIRAFDQYQVRWPSMTLNAGNVLLARRFTLYRVFCSPLCKRE